MRRFKLVPVIMITVALLGAASLNTLVTPVMNTAQAAQSSGARPEDKTVTIYFDVTRSTKFGWETDHIFYDVQRDITTIPLSQKEKRKQEVPAFIVGTRNMGLRLGREGDMITHGGHGTVEPGYYYWKLTAIGDDDWRQFFPQPLAALRVRLEANNRYYLGNFRMARGVFGGEIAYWTPGDLARAEAHCEKVTTLKTTRDKPKQPCELVPALVSDKPVKAKLRWSFRR